MRVYDVLDSNIMKIKYYNNLVYKWIDVIKIKNKINLKWYVKLIQFQS